MLIYYVFFPLIGFSYTWLLVLIVRKKKKEIVMLVAHAYIINVILGLWAFWKVCILGNVQYSTIGTWINCGSFVVNWGFLFDSLSVSMLLMVSIVSGTVHFYSLGYMESDKHLVRFMSYLSLFTFFMFILVTADNFVQLFLGWEGIGLCSYLLISFWNTRIQANKAALKAMVLNRIGDFGFICGLVLIAYYFKSLDFSIVFSLVSLYSTEYINVLGIEFLCLDIICIFLFIGSMGKSAQLGLHTWLPDAMEGPTPVSALIHAATLVTAGIFLIIRCSPIFEYAPTALFFVTVIGGVTALFAATVAIAQNDIKKVIAYSTASQLGYMTFICGISSYNVSMFHLINHAFFKALLFLGAGSVIHAMSGEQDMRKYGSLINLVPYTYSMILIGFFALAGIPFLSAFYSKDIALEIAFSKYTVSGIFVYWLGTVSAGLTAFYSFRVLVVTFWSKSNSYKYYVQNVHELPIKMGVALCILSIGSIFSGYYLKDAFVGIGSIFWGNSIYIAGENSIGLDMEYIPLAIKNIPIYYSFLGIFWAICSNWYWDVLVKWNLVIIKSTNNVLYNQKGVFYMWFFNKKWYFDYIYNYYLGYTLLKHSYVSFYKLIDKGFLEICGAQGISRGIYKLVILVSKNQSGYIYQSGCLLILWLFCLLYVMILI